MSLIKKAENNKDRQDTYRYQLGRYKKAINNEFYFEAMIIVYALLEDRFKAFLYYCGLFANRNSLKLNKKVRPYIMEIVYGGNTTSRMPSFGNINTKASFCEAILDWAAMVRMEDIESNTYFVALKQQIECVDIGGMQDVLGELTRKDTGWLSYRNEIIHASMNKNVEALYEDLKDQVEKGMEYARFIDGQVRVLKKNGRARKIMGLQNN